ncbi:membrane protein [Labrys miyagiensis]|uniref:Membrane protein n=1 Tax=Labrys miyagiensis TaxID=346912 RepID=A0ABQ6CMC5_9HYPH|nr:AI-2E family transporter YdiK [Labrys miyagiensis]GLS21448.1 membrane protein [Labrys miyagiensis]
MPQSHQDIGRITLNVLFIGGLLLASFFVLRPFLPAILWATTLVLATWPLMRWVERHVGNRRGIAVLIMTALILMLLIVPLWLAVSKVVTNLDVIADLLRKILLMRIPAPPPWLADVPIVGARIADTWEGLTSTGVQDLAATWLAPYAGTATQWLASVAGSLGGLLVQLLLSTVLAAVLYAGGENAGAYMLRFGRRMARERGERAVALAGQAIRAVALGVVVTALVQSLIGGIGLVAVGVDFAALLTALMFILCLVQVGPGFVLLPAVIWLFYSGEVIRGAALLAFTLVAGTIDQIIRPVLIRRGANLPLLLIMAGVIGGLITFGLLGIFIGPTVLAVAYTLLTAWISEDDEPQSEELPAVEPLAKR